jgi:hypothetical protein
MTVVRVILKKDESGVLYSEIYLRCLHWRKLGTYCGSLRGCSHHYVTSVIRVVLKRTVLYLTRNVFVINRESTVWG